MNPYQNRMQDLDARIVRANQGVQPISLTEEEIASVENELGHRFPEDYRLFLRDCGCYSLYSFYRCEGCYSGWGGISLFYGVPPTDSHPFPFNEDYDLLLNHETLKAYLPPELIAIGDTNGNIVTCLAMDGTERGAIYLWDRAESFDGEDYTGVHFVAPSFDAFIQMLLTEEQYEEASK